MGQRELRCVNGRYQRDLGWRLDPDGKWRQPRFYLGTDKQAAELASLRLEQFWDSITAGAPAVPQNAPEHWWEVESDRWTQRTLKIADAIRLGRQEYAVPSGECSDKLYYEYIQWHRRRFKGIAFVAEDAETYQLGEGIAKMGMKSLRGHVDEMARRLAQPATESLFTSHQALDDYAAWCRDHYRTKTDRPEDSETSDFGKVEAATALRLKKAHESLPLDRFDFQAIERIVNFYKARPASQTYASRGKKRIAVDTVIGAVKTLRRFTKWLRKRKTTYYWQPPDDLDELWRLSRKALLSESEKAAQKDGVPTYTPAELVTLYKYATPFEKVFLLCGINFSFARSECRSFLWSEIAEQDSRVFVKRIRLKTEVYGEYFCWPETWAAINWYREHRSGNSRWVLCAEDGGKLSGQRIQNIWNKLLDRVQKDHPQFRRLPFKFLRKTSAQLMQDCGAFGQTIRTFQSRGKPVPSDRYADKYYRRKFKRVFRFLSRMHKRLAPMFAACPDPFAGTTRKSYVTRATIDRIRELAAAGVSKSEICRQLGVSRPTVYRWLPQEQKTTVESQPTPDDPLPRSADGPLVDEAQ